ncbi:MAG: competence/damage-inducible protein A [Thermacetogeniaceae bacterium]
MYKAEIIAIGDELLRGDVVNTTAPFILDQVRELGYELIRITTVGDESDRIVKAVQEAIGAAEIIFLTGGLGPTPDDITRESLARAINQPLEFQADLWREIQDLFCRRGRETPPANINQAYLPLHAQAVPNALGTACGILVEYQSTAIIVLPGPPQELRRMFQDTIRPYLERRYPVDPQGRQQSRIFKVFGIGESEVMERVQNLLAATRDTGIRFGFYPRNGEVHIVLKTMGGEDKDRTLLDHLSGSLSNLLGDDLYGTGDDTLPAVTGDLLRSYRQTVGTAESCTGGLIAHYLTGTPGSSEYFRGGIIAYNADVKEKMLGVRQKTIDTFGVVSEQTVIEMATGARSALGVDFGLATTGLAGPSGGTEETPVGTVYVGLAAPDGTTALRLCWPRVSRSLVKAIASKKAIDLLRRRLINRYGED